MVEISRRLKEVFDREVRSLLQSVRKAVRALAEGTRESFTSAPVAVDKRLEVVGARTAETSKSAERETSSSHTASSGAHAGASESRSSSCYVSRKEAPLCVMPNSPEVHDPCDHSGYGA